MPIRLLRFPLRVYVRSRAHFDELVREFQLVDIGRTAGTADERPLPRRLLQLVEQITHQYQARVDAIDAIRAAAIARGEISIDMEYDAPVAARDAIATLMALMEECDDFCRTDEYLLTLATPPDIAAFRRWNIGQVIAQIAGAEPTPWPGEL